VYTGVFIRLNGGPGVFISCDGWQEGLTYHKGRLQITRIEVIGDKPKLRKLWLAILTAFSQGAEVHKSAAKETVAAALIVEHTHEQHQRNDCKSPMLACNLSHLRQQQCQHKTVSNTVPSTI